MVGVAKGGDGGYDFYWIARLSRDGGAGWPSLRPGDGTVAWLDFEVESRDGSYRERIRFVGKTLTIGREVECDIVVGHSRVSAVHARIIRSGRQFRVEDAGSRNGLALNRMPIGTAAVHGGDILTLGRRGPRLHLLELNAGPAILPRVILSLLILLLTAGGVFALRQDRVEVWLSQARLWLPEYEGAKWFAAKIPVDRPEPEPEQPPEESIDRRLPENGPTSREAEPGAGDPRTRELPNPPTNFGDDPFPARRLPFDLHTPLADGKMTLPGPTGGSAREALARTMLDPPNLAGSRPKLSTRYVFAEIRRGVDIGTVNEKLKLAKAQIRATFPDLNFLLVEVPESGPALSILRQSGAFGFLTAATEGAPGGVNAKTQATALAGLVRSLDPNDLLPPWADEAAPGDRRDAVISRLPPAAGNLSLDIESARIASLGERIVVVYELVSGYGLPGLGTTRRETRAFVLVNGGARRGETRDLPLQTWPNDLRKAVEPILPLKRAEDE